MGFTDLFTMLEKLINERGSSAILQSQVALFRDQLDQLEAEHDRVKAENKELKETVIELQKKLQQVSISEEFVKYRGVLFRRLPNGKAEDEVYCPRCKVVMCSFGDVGPFECSVCHFIASFSGVQLAEKMKGLPLD